MNDLDPVLALLRDEPAPEALHGIDGAIMAGLALGRERQRGRRALVLACGVAAVVGLWGGLSGGLDRNRAYAHEEALLGLPAAAPSHLLAS